MNGPRFGMFLIVSSLAIVSGCAKESGPPAQAPVPVPDKEAKIESTLDKLDPADRKLAEEQKYCAVETENRLGVMGVPIKIVVKDQPVFLCCKGCEKRALKDPEKTLETVGELKAANAESHQK